MPVADRMGAAHRGAVSAAFEGTSPHFAVLRAPGKGPVEEAGGNHMQRLETSAVDHIHDLLVFAVDTRGLLQLLRMLEAGIID